MPIQKIKKTFSNDLRRASIIGGSLLLVGLLQQDSTVFGLFAVLPLQHCSFRKQRTGRWPNSGLQSCQHATEKKKKLVFFLTKMQLQREISQNRLQFTCCTLLAGVVQVVASLFAGYSQSGINICTFEVTIQFSLFFRLTFLRTDQPMDRLTNQWTD